MANRRSRAWSSSRSWSSFKSTTDATGRHVSNALQTNGTLLDENWCRLFREYNWFVGLSLDGPEAMNDLYRYNKERRGTWRRVMQSVELLQKHGVEFNILCVVSQANVGHAKELYRFYQGVWASITFNSSRWRNSMLPASPLPFTIAAEQYGRFLVELFDAWWPDRPHHAHPLLRQHRGEPGRAEAHHLHHARNLRQLRGGGVQRRRFSVRFFRREALETGQRHGGFVEPKSPAARAASSSPRRRRWRIPDCQVCEYQSICHGGCPKFRAGPHRQFEDLDYFCTAYKMIYAKATGPLRRELGALVKR